MTSKEQIDHNQDQKLSAIERLQKLGYDNYIVNQCLSQYEHARRYGSGIGLEDFLVNAIEVLVRENQDLKGLLIEAKIRQPMQFILPQGTKAIG